MIRSLFTRTHCLSLLMLLGFWLYVWKCIMKMCTVSHTLFVTHWLYCSASFLWIYIFSFSTLVCRCQMRQTLTTSTLAVKGMIYCSTLEFIVPCFSICLVLECLAVWLHVFGPASTELTQFFTHSSGSL